MMLMFLMKIITLLLKGKLGELGHQFDKEMIIDISDNEITVSRPSDLKKFKEFMVLLVHFDI